MVLASKGIKVLILKEDGRVCNLLARNLRSDIALYACAMQSNEYIIGPAMVTGLYGYMDQERMDAMFRFFQRPTNTTKA